MACPSNFDFGNPVHRRSLRGHLLSAALVPVRAGAMIGIGFGVACLVVPCIALAAITMTVGGGRPEKGFPRP